MKTEYQYISFRTLPISSRVTSRWDCLNNRGHYTLGEVRWHGSWRQY